ncbi:oligosaccharide flippase family protein, partial [Neobacillus vireti]
MIQILKNGFWNLFGTVFIILSGAILTLVAPKILTVEQFGLWRMFILYSTYAGILHLGVADGYLLNNVSKSISNAFNSLRRSMPFLIVQQILISAIIYFILLLYINDKQLLFIAASVLIFSITINLRTLVDNFLIISKDFRRSNIVKIMEKALFLLVLFAFLTFGKISYQLLIGLFIFASLSALIFLIILVKPKIELSKGIVKDNISDIKIGSQLLSSNILIILLFNIDSVFVNMYLGIKSFAIFSFAITIIMLINQFAESISQVLFPYLATDLRNKLFSANIMVVSGMFGLWVLILQFSFLFLPLI